MHVWLSCALARFNFIELRIFLLIKLFSSTHSNVFLNCFSPGPFGFTLPSLQVSGGRATQRVEALGSTLLVSLVGFLYLIVTCFEQLVCYELPNFIYLLSLELWQARGLRSCLNWGLN